MGKENPGNAVNLLCEGTVIVGDIKTKNDIRIDGIIKGKIITSGRLVVGNTAKTYWGLYLVIYKLPGRFH